jgi:hypothetical protein
MSAKMLEHLRECYEMLHNVEKCWKMLENVHVMLEKGFLTSRTAKDAKAGLSGAEFPWTKDWFTRIKHHRGAPLKTATSTFSPETSILATPHRTEHTTRD